MPLRPTLLLVMLFSVAGDFGLFAQASQPGTLPKDASSLLSLIQEKSGLDSLDVKPWHIRGHYTIYDKDGKPQDSGIYEEWWASPHRYKRSFASSHFTQTEYATSNGLYREGSQDWSTAELAIREALISPMREIQPGDFNLEEQTESVGKANLTCLFLSYPVRRGEQVTGNYFPNYCVDKSLAAALRLASTGMGSRTVYNQIVEYQGHYLAREIHAITNNNRLFDFSLESAAPFEQVADSFFDPPADAKKVDLLRFLLPLVTRASV